MIRNFLFHRVNPERDPLWDPMDVKLFERCIKYISSHYEVMQIEDLVFSDKLHLNNKIATIMFDDGYKDNIDFAAPILAKYNCKASFYVVTDCIENNIPTWTHILEHSFQFTKVNNIKLDFDFLPDELKINTLNSKSERLNYVSKLKPCLKKLSHENRNLVLDSIKETYTDVEIPKLMMNWDDLRQLKNAGHYIGSHTLSHCMLGTMSDEAMIKKELIDSAELIKNKLGHFPITISYPVGSYHEATKRLAKASGYKIGLAVKQDIYNPKRDDIFEIPRIELYNEAWWKTRMRISHSLEKIKSLIRRR
jgi:peptidoglycan/xylan/chitin deacetylase (PgdA/CDA1 family)